MYAIVESRGRQYKVSPGQEIELDFMKVESGTPYTFEKVLMLVNDENEVVLDPKELDQVKVSGTVTGDKKGRKLVVFKYKRRKGYHRKLGHRQSFTLVKVEGIENTK